MESLQLAFLGQPRITLGEASFPELASEKWVALLAYLALTGEQYARPQLEALLWGDSPAENAQTSLRTAVYNINKRLDTPLQTSRKAVWFAPKQPFSLDVQQLQQLLRQGDPDSLETAVSLYRGDFLAGLTVGDAPEFEMWLLQARERFRLEILSALDQLIAHDQQTGDVDAVILHSRRLLEIEPWREATHRHLMRLLARSGDYNAAIRQYHHCQAMLTEELAIDPMPETTALYERILTLRQQPPNRSLPPAPPLVGREPELAELVAHLADPACRLVVITGMGGMGKSTLATALAHHQQRSFLDGVGFVTLGDLETAALLETAVADALGIALRPTRAPKQQLLDYLRDRELLLMLDGGEHLLTAVTDLIQAVIAHAPDVKIVLTSREKPRLFTAAQVNVTGLPLPAPGLVDAPATTLFIRQARRVQPAFEPQPIWPDVVTLCRLLEGSPLAIELAAAQLDLVDCAQLVEQVKATMAVLSVDFVDMPERHRSLHALFAHSWRLLTPAEQIALAKLAVFRGGFTAVAAAQIAEVTPPILRTLLAKSLLSQQDGRFSLHALIRQFALDHLPAETAVFLRHARYFSQQLSDRRTGQMPEPPADLLAELDNIRAMWQFAIHAQETVLLAEATHGLARLYALTNQFVAGKVLFAEAVKALTQTAVPTTAPLVWGELLGRYAMFLFRTGDLPVARQMAAESVDVLRSQDASEALAFSLNLLGTLLLQSGAFETAVPLFTECADLYRQLNSHGLVKPLINLGSLHMRLGNYAAAIDQLNEALPLVEAEQDRRGMAHILNNLAANHLALGDLETAYHHLMTCLPLTEETGYDSVRLVVLQNLAELSHKRGEFGEAIAHSESGLMIADRLGDAVQKIRIQKVEALARFAVGQAAAAWRILGEAIRVGYEMEALAGLMDVLAGAGELLLAVGNTAVAVELLHFVASHPATEKQYVQEATVLLTANGWSIEGVGEAAKRPLSEIVPALLAALPGESSL